MGRERTKEELESQKRIMQLIKQYCEGRQQLFADRCGIGKSSVSQYVNGTNSPGNITASKIADAFYVNPMWVMGFDAPMRPDAEIIGNSEAVNVPVYGRVAAGNGLYAFEDVIGYVAVSKRLTTSEDIYALMIRGDSMEPKISDGDIVIVRKQSDADNGDIVIALINGCDAVCKRLKKYDGGIMLVSNNPKYDPLVFANKDVNSIPVRVIGKVMELRVQF